MIVTCPDCQRTLEDEYRSTVCPHETFAANDGKNNFSHHPEAHLSDPSDTKRQYPVLVVCALIAENGYALMERHAPRDQQEGYLWDIPGGKVEIGETPMQAVVREIREEMNVEIEVVRLLPRLDTSRWGDHHWVLATYECRIVSGTPPFSDDLQWLPISLMSEMHIKTPDIQIVREFAAGKL